MEARKMASHQFIDRPMGILGLFFFKGLLNFLTKEETLTQVRWLLTSEVNNYLFITDYFQYKIGIAFQLALHTNQNSQNKWTKIPANLPDQFSRSGQIFFALGSSNSEGASTLFYDRTRDSIANNFVIDFYCRCLQILYQIAINCKI